jgi:hypothetical protein
MPERRWIAIKTTQCPAPRNPGSEFATITLVSRDIGLCVRARKRL